MGVLDKVKSALATEERAVMRCDECESTFETDLPVDDPACPECGSTETREINRTWA